MKMEETNVTLSSSLSLEHKLQVASNEMIFFFFDELN